MTKNSNQKWKLIFHLCEEQSIELAFKSYRYSMDSACVSCCFEDTDFCPYSNGELVCRQFDNADYAAFFIHK